MEILNSIVSYLYFSLNPEAKKEPGKIISDIIDFWSMFQHTMTFEGGYVFHPKDPGGETYRGISRKNFPNWEGWDIIDAFKLISDLPLDFKKCPNVDELNLHVKNFYKKEFFDKLHCELFKNNSVASELFDSGVNTGIGNSVKFLQRALNLLNSKEKYYDDLIVDGMIGNKTISAANYLIKIGKSGPLFVSMNGEQYCHYKKIAEARPDFELFFSGWTKRIGF